MNQESRRLPYSACPHKLKRPSMQRHFLHATSITVNKLFHSYPNLSAEEFFEPPAAGNIRRRNFKVCQPSFHLARRKAAFVERSSGPWNRLVPHTSLKLRQCPVSRIARMSTFAQSSLIMFDPTPFSFRM